MIAEQYTKSIKDYIDALEQPKEAYTTSMKFVYANEHGIPAGTKVQIKKGLEEKYFSLKGNCWGCC